MKKWLVALLVVFALLVLISPGLVGLIAERGLEQAVEQTDRNDAEVTVTTEKFDRAWFSSAGRHRVELRRGDLYQTASRIAAEAGEDRLPALIINTELAHGIRPFPDSGSIMPVLAKSESTLQLETSGGELFDIPGILRSEVGLTGTTRSHYVLEPGSHAADRAEWRWDGADLRFSITPSGSWATLNGTVAPWSLDTEVTGMRSGPISIDAEAEDTEYGFRTGKLALDLQKLSLNDAVEPLSIEHWSIEAESDLRRGRVEAILKTQIESLVLPTIGAASIDLDFTVENIDAQSIRNVIVATQAAQTSPDPNIALAELDELVRDDLLLLLSRGIDLNLQEFTMSLPQGDLHGSLSFRLPNSDTKDIKGWSSLLLQTEAEFAFEIAGSLLEHLQSTEPDIGTLIGLGYLRPDGDNYKMVATIDGGQISINGAPMAIPMTGD